MLIIHPSGNNHGSTRSSWRSFRCANAVARLPELMSSGRSCIAPCTVLVGDRPAVPTCYRGDGWYVRSSSLPPPCVLVDSGSLGCDKHQYGQRECQRLFRGPYQRKDYAIPVPTLDVANQDAGDSAAGEARATPGSPPATPVLRQSKSAVVAPHSAPHTARPGAGRGGGDSGGGTNDSGGRVVGRPRSMSLGSADSGARTSVWCWLR